MTTESTTTATASPCAGSDPRPSPGAGEASVLYHDDAVVHPPDGEFAWYLSLTREIHDIENGYDALVVRSPVTPGEYRFVHWVIVTETNRDGESALGARFTVTAV